jgi:hypothetical protein
VVADPLVICTHAQTPEAILAPKVIGAAAPASRQTRIRFTSLSPELKVWVQQMAARLATAPVVRIASM